MSWSNHWLVQSTLLGVLLGIGFVVPALWPLGLLGVAGVFYKLSHQEYRWYQVWLVWFVKSLVFGSWLWAVYPLDWLGPVSSVGALVMIGIYWGTIAAALASGGVVLALLFSVFRRFVSLWVMYVVFPLLWLVAELVGSIAYSVFLYGPGGSVNIKFSMGYVGYLLGQHGVLIQLASVYGVYGLSVASVALAVGGVWLYQQMYRYALYAAGIAVLLSSSISVAAPNTSKHTYDIAVVDTQLPYELTTAELTATQSDILAASRELTPDYVIFPEDHRLFDQSKDEALLQAMLAFTYHDQEAVIVDSGRVDRDTGSYLQAAIYDGVEKKLYQSQKSYLVPQGEYLPYVYAWMFTLVGQAESAVVLNERLSYNVGEQTSQSHYGTRIPAVLFCFEVFDPSGVRTAVAERSTTVPFVAHVLSHAWINNSQIFEQQLQTMLQVQAIWNDVYIVSAANHAVGYTVTPTGGIWYPETKATGEYWSLGTIAIPVR